MIQSFTNIYPIPRARLYKLKLPNSNVTSKLLQFRKLIILFSSSSFLFFFTKYKLETLKKGKGKMGD